MKLKLTRADGSIVEAEGTPEECATFLGTVSIVVAAPKETPSEEIRRLLAEAVQRLQAPAPSWVTPVLYPYGPWWYGTPYYPNYQFPWSRGTTPGVGQVTIGDIPGWTSGVSSGTILWNPNDQVSRTISLTPSSEDWSLAADRGGVALSSVPYGAALSEMTVRLGSTFGG